MILLPSEFIDMAARFPVVDVRTPAEFEKGHIPGACNIPLFSNEERAVVGTLYKQQGKDIALMKGLDYVGPKMRSFVKEARKIARDNTVLVHCWRGGMRSASMAWLFRTGGLNAHTLEGGYKAYRRFIHRTLNSPAKRIVLGGYTGSGKTEILKALAQLGQQVIDLEGLAHHKGSAFGHIGEEKQPTTEQFENNLARQWMKIEADKPVWLEDESRHIGHVFQPENFYKTLRQAPLIFVEVPKEARIRHLVKAYAHIDHQALVDALDKIHRRLGGLNHSRAKKALDASDYATVADITLNYYDKAYAYGLTQRDKAKVHHLKVKDDHPDTTAQIILDYLQKHPLF